MKFGDKVMVKDGSQVDGSIGIVYSMEEERAIVLLDKEVLWPVSQKNLDLLDDDR